MLTSARLQYSLFLDKIVTNDLLYDLIFNACSARSLVRLLRTCQALRLSVKDYISRAFNINILLARYFTDPMEFRRLQACTSTLISGSTALQFFDRSYYPGSDLDLYVPLAWRESVGRYLLDQGYMFVPNRTQKSIFASAVKEKRLFTNKGVYGNFKGIAAVFTFRKHSTRGEELQVQVIVAVRSPMEVILRFHSTCVMNVVMFNKAYCLYPRATLDERLSLVSTDRNDGVIERVFDRYKGRGWTIVSSLSQMVSRTGDPTFGNIVRWIEDGFSWTIPLPIQLQQPQPPINTRTDALSQDPTSISSWTIAVGPTQRAYMKFYHVSCPQLFYPYVVEHIAAVYTPEVTYLLEMAKEADEVSSELPLNEERHFVDERFIQLCTAHYRGVF